jgi:YrbI family 3-deoxy-D-manno-octulosonate 8-phosphate phosphatase
VLAELELEPEQVCHIGDDLTDLSLLQYVGLSVAVADAAEEVRAAAHYVTAVAGGRGAVREVIELVLKAKNRWEDLIRNYTL